MICQFLVNLMYMSVSILLTCKKHLHDHIISLRREVYTHYTSLTLPLFIEVPELRQDSERACMCVLGLLILCLFVQFSCWILELFDRVVFFFFFILYRVFILIALVI